jgi:predicted exporter
MHRLLLFFQSFNRYRFFYYLLPVVLGGLAWFSVAVKTDISAFILAGDKSEEVIIASEMQSGALSRRYLISLSDKQNANVPAVVAAELQKKLRTIPGVSDVWLPSQQREAVQALLELYSRYAGAIYSLNPQREVARIFTSEGLQERAALLKQVLLSPQGPAIKKIVRHDPLLLTLKAFQGQATQMQRQGQSDARYQNLVLETAVAGLDVPAQLIIQDAINHEFATLNDKHSGKYQLEMTGVPLFAVATQTLIKGDIGVVSALSSLALMGLFLLIFRSFGTLFQVFTLLSSVILVSILVVQFSFGYVHGMTIALGSTLVGICIDYPIHAIVHAQIVNASQRTAVVARIWPSMLLGGLTTMIGYMALGGSGYPGFQQIAVYAASGITTALLLTRFVLPKLVKTGRQKKLNMPMVSRWAYICQRYRIGLLCVLLAGLVVALMGLRSLQWIDDMQQLTPELNYLKENDRRIRARMVSIEPGRFILISANNAEQALQRTEQVYGMLDEIKARGELTDYFGLYPWLLSEQQQRQNLKLLEQQITPENIVLWQQALKQQGLSVSALGQLDYKVDSTLDLETVVGTAVKRLIDSRIISDTQQTVVMIWLAEHDFELVKTAFSSMDGVQYFSYRNMLNGMLSDYTQQAQKLLSVGLTLIILLLTIRYKSLLTALQTLLPAVMAAFFILGIWSLTGALISFLHLVGFLLAVAICVDYGIFYQENRGGDIELTYQAMAASMLTSALAFGSLIVAESSALRVLAGVVALGVALGFLFCPIIIRHR